MLAVEEGGERMQHGVTVPPPPPARSAEAHLEGLGTVVMLKMRQRIIERLEETDTRFRVTCNAMGTCEVSYRCITQSTPPTSFAELATSKDRAEFADWMIRRMAQNRLRDGKKMDSIIAASYKAFLPNLMAQAIRKIK